MLALAAGAGSRVASAPQEPVEEIFIGGVTPRFAVPECVPRTRDERTLQACRTLTQVLRNDLRFPCSIAQYSDAVCQGRRHHDIFCSGNCDDIKIYVRAVQATA